MSYEPKFPIVGMGASAGGIAAMEVFFKSLPSNPGLAFVVVTHLNPDRESLLHEVLARFTSLPVCVAREDMEVERNRVYVMPAGVVLTIKNGRLQSDAAGRDRHGQKPVDVFLASLAQDQNEYGVAIILSGGDGDGTLGAKAVREAGGLTIAQGTNGTAPLHPEMPQSAITTGIVDLVVPVEDMPERLSTFVRSFETLENARISNEEQSTRELQDIHSQICGILRKNSGHDFSGYKTKTFFRRVHRRMQVKQIASLGDYAESLKGDAQEVTDLFRDLMINVTNFFRDEDAFAQLQERIIPKLFEGKSASDTIRIWVPGCATGEEVYSIAILMREHLSTLSVTPKVQVFATDIDESALAIARAGRYPEALLSGVSHERLRRFFRHDAGSYVISAAVRELCIFSPHSLIRDPPFSRMDMVSCRNLLIYFGPEIQRQVIPIFHYSLKPGCFLFLGSSESIGQHSDLFTTLDKKSRIFQAREHPARLPRISSLSSNDHSHSFPNYGTSGRESSRRLREKAESSVLERHTPAHILINTDADVLYYSANTGRFLEPPQGTPSRQLFTLARKGLRLDLRSAFQECVTKQQPVRRQNILVDREHEQMLEVEIVVEPVNAPGEESVYLIVFRGREACSLTEKEEAGASSHSDTITGLERELRDTKERLQSTIEEYETALEELKSSNEELVSLNEEAQSSNEELEASKEETQSLNEELSTINAELNGKVEELDRVNADLRNLFESTQIATIFLDRSLGIRSFTPAAASFFSLRPGDLGRPLTELSSKLVYSNLRDDIQGVFDSAQALDQRLTRDDAGNQYLVRLIPYLGQHDEVEGVVVTLVDVTPLAEAEQRQQVLVSELNHRVKNMLAVVNTLTYRTLDSAGSIEEFRETFMGRLSGMAKAYGRLARDGWKDASLTDVFTSELEPFGSEHFSITGSEFRLKAQVSLSLSLVVHELTTNAAKYGSLSVPKGRIEVAWSINDKELHVSWREIDGPHIKSPQTLGFGHRLLRGEVEYRMQGRLDMQFEPGGLIAQIYLPLETVQQKATS